MEYKLLALASADVNFVGDDKTGIVEGYASVFNGVDAYKDTILPGAYATTLKSWASSGMPLPMVDEHFGPVIGKWIVAQEDERGLRVKGELTPGHSRAADVYASLRHGSVRGLSIGFSARDAEPSPDGRRMLKAIELHEISIVSRPADPRALTDAVKAISGIETLADFERTLRDAVRPFTRKEVTALTSRFKSIVQRDAEAERLSTEWLEGVKRRAAALITSS